MIPFTRIVAGSAASLLLAAGTTSLAGTPAGPMPVHLICQGDASDSLCSALAKALADVAGNRPVVLTSTAATEAPATVFAVKFIEERRTTDSLAGHLIWHGPNTPAGIGPSLEFSIMDAALTTEALHHFAAQLVHHSNLPL